MFKLNEIWCNISHNNVVHSQFVSVMVCPDISATASIKTDIIVLENDQVDCECPSGGPNSRSNKY